MGRKLYYYHKNSGLEIDFVIRYRGKCTLVEVKATTGNAKSVKTILRHPEKYHVYDAIKLGDYNIGRSDQILTLPTYMAFYFGNSKGTLFGFLNCFVFNSVKISVLRIHLDHIIDKRISDKMLPYGVCSLYKIPVKSDFILDKRAYIRQV